MKHLATGLAILLGAVTAVPRDMSATGIFNTHQSEGVDIWERGSPEVQDVDEHPPGCHDDWVWWQFRKPLWESETSNDTCIHPHQLYQTWF